MSLFFISGVSGTGKSTLMEELRQREEEAHDTDSESIRVSKVTGKVLSYKEAKENGYSWIYSKEALHKLKDLSFSKDVFLLGFPDNLQEVKDTASEYIWMSIPRNELIKRLDSRQKEYGKSVRERNLILAQYEKMNKTIEPGTFTLDATKPVNAIADDLLTHIRKS
jgi:gluconate kinase